MKDLKAKLSALWIFATLNYLYCDVVGLMDPNLLKQFMAGNIGSVHISQAFLLGAGVLVEIPMAMILVSRIASYRPNRVANIAAGTVMTVVQLMSLVVKSPTLYYAFFSVIEIACTAVIVWSAWRWHADERVSLRAAAAGARS